MSLDDYAWQARLIADELLELLSPQEEAAFRQKLDDDDPECWRDMSAAALQRALAFATATPSKRRATWDRTAEADRLPLWVLARAYALRSANILAVVRDVGDVRGLGYRKAVRHVAEAVHQQHLLPGQDELLDPAP
ncbi:MAG: hypothetical protein ACOY4C_04155 [Pseudomonadota bacterium]